LGLIEGMAGDFDEEAGAFGLGLGAADEIVLGPKLLGGIEGVSALAIGDDAAHDALTLVVGGRFVPDDVDLSVGIFVGVAAGNGAADENGVEGGLGDVGLCDVLGELAAPGAWPVHEELRRRCLSCMHFTCAKRI
jgi:hypothetical protein